jgi:uncharacterized protein (DUF488 family)
MVEDLDRLEGVLVLTVGHSTRPLDDFIALLNDHGVELLVDVRTVPRSRHNPQFDRETLPERLAAAGIRYVHLAGLGGLRHAKHDSINTAWRNASFRGFADYMQTPEFDAALEELVGLARTKLVTIMCAEAVPWRCHRSLIADALVAVGAQVEHVLALGRRQPHRLMPFARVDGARVTYPAPIA